MSGDIEYVRISIEACVVEGCGGMLHSDRTFVHYRCPICHETYIRFGALLVQDLSIPRAIVVTREDK